MLVPPIPGVQVIADDAVTLPGAGIESDESAFERYDYKVKHPDTGGNKHDYLRWVEPMDGIGKVRVIPRWAGNGTVKVVVVGDDFLPATQEVVDSVQVYLDPLLNVIAQAEAMTLGGYGATVDSEQSFDSGSSVKMLYDAAGAGTINYGFGGSLEELLETENTFTASIKAAVDSIVSVNDLLQIRVQDRGTKVALKTTKGGAIDAVATFKASDFAAANILEEKALNFYWDGLQPIEIEMTRLTTDTATTLWVDYVNFKSVYGQGLGYGQAPGGARVTVKAADELAIDVAATITYSAGADVPTTRAAVTAALNSYLQSVVFEQGIDVVYARIGSILINTVGVSNYTGLLVNGATADVVIPVEAVPVLGQVTI
jgi:uncharacterized phage protein gp47/JayE